MSEFKLANNIIIIVVQSIVSLLSVCALAYAGLLNAEIARINSAVTKTEARLTTDIARLRQDVEAVARDQKMTIERLHVEYCGIQKSLADINVSVTALNSRLISRDDVEKISRREATLYHQSAEASKRENKK
jgi:outer membrane murein-binding lipoprotein Lpp